MAKSKTKAADQNVSETKEPEAEPIIEEVKEPEAEQEPELVFEEVEEPDPEPVYDLDALWNMKFRDPKTGVISKIRYAFKPRGKLEFYHPQE